MLKLDTIQKKNRNLWNWEVGCVAGGRWGGGGGIERENQNERYVMKNNNKNNFIVQEF